MRAQFTLSVLGMAAIITLGWSIAFEARAQVEGDAVGERAVSDAEAPKEDLAAVAAAGNQFAFDVYHKLGADGGNFFYSPLSISTAFTMAYEGARGETAEQMAGVFHYPQHDGAIWANERLHRATGTLLDRFNGTNQDANESEEANARPFELAIANRMWCEKSRPFLPAFMQTMEEHYGAGLVPADFTQNAEATRREINRWVEAQTNDRIRDLMPAGSIDAATRLVLVNAIYFKGDWAMPFREAATRDLPFTLASGDTVETKMMHHKARYGYLEADGFKALEMRYKGDHLSMLVLLPDEAAGLPKLEAKLSEETVAQWISQLRSREVEVRFPRFKLESKFSLNDTLKQLGMPLAFSDAADFSGFTGSDDLFISAAIHQAFVEVTEKGTEAAAATGIAIATKSAPIGRPAVFHADHPFVFLIRDRETGAILFIGRFAKPS